MLISESTSSSRVKNARTGIKIAFKQQKIEEFAWRLDRFRSALTLASVLALRTSAESNHVEVLTRLRELQDDHMTDRAIYRKNMQILVDFAESQSVADLNKVHATVQRCLNDLSSEEKRLPLNRERSILAWLNFRQISDRYEEIPTAYQDTFRWIFEKPSTKNNWDDFTHHLNANVSKPFFINGKAGSGKSTLMKYIVDNARTKRALTSWTRLSRNGSQLVLAKFFFWNLGTPMQKSTPGLLRALLATVLQAHPSLIPAVLPDIYQNWKPGMEEPTYTELKRAWKILIDRSKSFLRLAIFIDGLDEFEGDHTDFAKFVLSLVSPNVKVIVSSRPINASLNAFGGCPSLRLQDLTKKDMELFVQGNLSSHNVMAQLMTHDPDATNDIVTEIKEKADGVFLWVKLVVTLLIEGLEAGDSVQELWTKLRSMPRDLRALYRRMLSKISSEYQVQAAIMFQLLQIWVSITGEPMTTLILHYATQAPAMNLQQSIGPHKPETLAWFHQQISARVRSRCCGLLEIRQYEGTLLTVLDLETFSLTKVEYLHRTVAEFLASEDVSVELQEMSSSSFDAFESLVAACLSVIKISGSLPYHSTIHYHLADFIKLYQAASSRSQASLNKYVQAVDEVMTTYQKKPYDGQKLVLKDAGHWSLHIRKDQYSASDYIGPGVASTQIQLIDWGKNPSDEAKRREMQKLYKKTDVCTFAALNGFTSYLKSVDPDNVDWAYRLLPWALESWPWMREPEQTVAQHDRRDLLLFLLDKASKPDQLGRYQENFEIAQRYAEGISTRSAPREHRIDRSLLLACFLVKAQHQESLLQTLDQSMVSDIIEDLQVDQDPQTLHIAHELVEIQRRMVDAEDAQPTALHYQPSSPASVAIAKRKRPRSLRDLISRVQSIFVPPPKNSRAYGRLHRPRSSSESLEPQRHVRPASRNIPRDSLEMYHS